MLFMLIVSGLKTIKLKKCDLLVYSEYSISVGRLVFCNGLCSNYRKREIFVESERTLFSCNLTDKPFFNFECELYQHGCLRFNLIERFSATLYATRVQWWIEIAKQWIKPLRVPL